MKKVLSIVFALILLPSIFFASGCGSKDNSSSDPYYEYVSHGKAILMGEYPQTIKSDDVEIVSSKPDKNGYYKGSDGERYVQHRVDLNYAKLGYGSEDNWKSLGCATLSNGHSYSRYELLYFKVEKIRWNIIHLEGNKALVVCDNIINQVAYQPYYAYYYQDEEYYIKNIDNEWVYKSDGTMIYANSYTYSNLRSFLIKDFYNAAFSKKQKSNIKLTEIDNSADSTNNPKNPYGEENTKDKVFALSYKELTNTEYGFDDLGSETSLRRIFKTTDYAKVNGAYTFTPEVLAASGIVEGSEIWQEESVYFGTGKYWTRSPRARGSGEVLIGTKGIINEYAYVNYISLGVVPAMYITL